jgi:hypothetical protein
MNNPVPKRILMPARAATDDTLPADGHEFGCQCRTCRRLYQKYVHQKYGGLLYQREAYPRGVCGKVAYPSEEIARKELAQISIELPVKYFYWCGLCDGYHLTSQLQKKVRPAMVGAH